MGRNGDVNNVKVASERSIYNVKEVECKALNYTKNRVKRTSISQARIHRAQRIADDLVRKFGPHSKNCYQYFCKCAYNLPESTIWNCYEDSRKTTVKNSLAYFLSVTKSQPQMV